MAHRLLNLPHAHGDVMVEGLEGAVKFPETEILDKHRVQKMPIKTSFRSPCLPSYPNWLDLPMSSEIAGFRAKATSVA